MSRSAADAETLRPIAEKTCRDIVGFSDGTIIMAATQCILQNMTKDKAVRLLTPYLASSTPDFVESLFRNVENCDQIVNEKERMRKSINYSKLYLDQIFTY